MRPYVLKLALKSTRSIRLALMIGLSASLVLISQGAPEARPHAPPAPPPVFPQPVAFELSPSLVRAASAYEDYMARAALKRGIEES